MPIKVMTRFRLAEQKLSREWRTKNFDHLLPVARQATRSSKLQERLAIPLKNRIKWWNVVPGDQVRIRGRESEGTREVLAIDKWNNEVYLKALKQPDTELNETTGFVGTPVHYSRCQLLVGRYQLARQNEDEPQRSIDVFAKRVATSRPIWRKYHWHWNRYAAAITPRLPEGTLPDGRLLIPWPITAPLNIQHSVSVYDTKQEVAHAVTWKPPNDLIYPSRERVKQWANLYLDYMSNPSENAPLECLPFELLASDELANPHSRAVKQKRWQAAVEDRKRDRARIIASHLADPTRYGSKKDAIAEAEWKFKQLVLHEDNQKRKKRWAQRGGPLKLMAKQQRKARKARALIRKLNNLTLASAPNQFIPAPTPPSISPDTNAAL